MFLHPYSLQNASCLSYFNEVSSVNSVVRNYFIWKIISFEFQNSSSFIFGRANSPDLGHYIMESLVKKDYLISSLMSNVTFSPYQRIWMDSSVIHPSQYCPGINSFLPEFFKCIKCSFKKQVIAKRSAALNMSLLSISVEDGSILLITEKKML